MGGIKNREEKKKKNHVVSSGAGGGTKGPSTIDKRLQEQKCPYCERVFKQPNRYKEHLQNKHSDEVAETAGPGEGAATAPAAPQAVAAGPEKGRMMEVGSAAGYYTSKSPQMILHEWCRRQNRPKPRYKVLPGEDGRFRCKVVLPDKDRSDADVVVFLAEEHAAGDDTEAQQRGAVAALAGLAQDLPLERVLPNDFRPLFQSIKDQNKARAERAAARAAAEEARRQRERARRAAEARRPAANVIMSDAQRKAVEGALASVRGAAGGSATELAASDDPDAAPEHEGADDLAKQLQRLGFQESDARRALAATRPSNGGSNGTSGAVNGARGQQAVSAALDWLCMHLPEEALPAKYAAGASSRPVSILYRGGGAAASSAADLAPSDADAAASDDPYVRWLAAAGYPPAEAAAALAATGGDREAALHQLYSAWSGATVLAEEGTAAAQPSQGWADEQEALAAIYGDAVSFPSPEHASLTLQLPSEAAQLLRTKPEELQPLTLDFRIAPAGPYPAVPPVISTRCGSLPPALLLRLTQHLASAAAAAAGEPMLHDVAAAATEWLSDAQQLRSVAPPRKSEAAGTADGTSGLALQHVAEVADKLHQAQASAGPQPQQRTRQRQRQRPERPAVDVAAESRRLAEETANAAGAPRLAVMREARAALPAAAARDAVLAKLRGHQVLVISGATGCGKSTQVPQFVLEDAVAAGRGGACNIVVTQPRRISATGLAHRVAAERGEAAGGVVGYSVRLDSRRSARTRILFCTTGVLLRRLLDDSELAGTTHVVIDEVHERSVDSDLLLLLLRDLLAGGKAPGLRLVLMSATADADAFARYFDTALGKEGAAGVLTIPGFTHPVRDLFLEDALEATGFIVGRGSKWAAPRKPAAVAPKDNTDKLAAYAGYSGKRAAQDANAPNAWDAEEPPPSEDPPESWDAEDGGVGIGGSAVHGASPAAAYSERTMQSLENINEEALNYELVERLVCHIVEAELAGGPGALLAPGDRQAAERAAGGGGAILIFMTGAMEIDRTIRALQRSQQLAMLTDGGRALRLLPLHGGLPPQQQQRVFDRPPPGVRKIVVATNVAETSITIDDVTTVIDAGRVKEMGYDPARGIACLQETWVSQAAAQQRRGRAGRVRPGVCFRLFSRATWATLQRQQPPEMLRVPLEGVILTVKATFGNEATADDVLCRALTPPEQAAVAAAVSNLKAMGALGAAEEVTPLGEHLTAMPVDPRVGKMLVHGALLRCAGPVLTIAAAMGHGRPLFYSPPDKRGEAQAAKQALLAAIPNAKSDHLAVVVAFDAWQRALEGGGRSAAAAFCAKHFIAYQVMEGIAGGRAEYAGILADRGFLPAAYVQELRRGGAASDAYKGPGGPDQYSGNGRVIKAALAAGFYPALLRVEHPPARFRATEGGSVQVDTAAVQVKFFERAKGRVFHHPSSVNFNCGRFESGWLVYTDMVQTSKVFVRESSMVPIYSVLLFGGQLTVLHDRGLLKVDGWAEFRAPARIGVLVRELRAGVAALLGQKIADPAADVAHAPIIDALHQLLASDGF